MSPSSTCITARVGRTICYEVSSVTDDIITDILTGTHEFQIDFCQMHVKGFDKMTIMKEILDLVL